MNIKFYRSVVARLAALVLLLAAGAAQATTYTFNGSDVAGCTRSGSSYTCAALPLANYNDSMVIASGATVKITSSVAFGFNQSLTMSGTAALTATGDLGIGDMNPSNLSISGGTLTASGGTFSMGAQAQTITANISATTINLGTGSTTKVTGSLTASGSIALGSHSTVVGPISAASVTSTSPVSITGNVTASNSFQLASGSTLTGNLVAPTVTLDPSPTNVVGNVTATTSLTLGSSDSITGNVVAGNVVLQDASASIGGNASVIAITLGWHGTVSGKITCTAPAGNGCSCVTNNSGYPTGTSPGPVCTSRTTTPPPAATLDHILITHGGTGLTCQPQPVTVQACADAACSVAYTGGVTGSMTPGGAPFTINAGSSSASASVSWPNPTTVSLSSSVTGSGTNMCTNTATTPATTNASSACQMTFADSAFVLSPLSTIAEKQGSVTVTAVQKDATTNVCTTSFQGSKTITLYCGYTDPGGYGIQPRVVDGNNNTLTCPIGASSPISVPLTFANGAAQLPFIYADVGKISVNAAYALSATTSMKGSGNVIVAPAAFQITQTGPALAGDILPLTVTAVNAATPAAATPSFGHESQAEGVTIGMQYVSPIFSDGSQDQPALSGSLGGFTGGAAINKGVSWDEVGVIKLTASLSDTGNDGYMGGKSIPATSNVNVTVIPHHFSTLYPSAPVAGSATVPMMCDPKTSTAQNCPATLPFVYSKQPFPLTVTAMDKAGAALKNYDGRRTANVSAARNVVLTVWDAANSTARQNPPGGTAPGVLSIVTSAAGAKATGLPPGAFNYGVATLAPGASPSAVNPALSYALPATSTTPTPVYLRAIDTDNASSLQASAVSEQGLAVVNGRSVVTANYGSELLPMQVRMLAQFLNASASWVTNAWDNGSTYSASDIYFYNCQKGLTTGARIQTSEGSSNGCNTALVALSGSPVMFSSGVASFRLQAPKASGSVDISLQRLDSSSPPAPYYSPVYLPSNRAREVFGVYKSGPVIYQREMY